MYKNNNTQDKVSGLSLVLMTLLFLTTIATSPVDDEQSFIDLDYGEYNPVYSDMLIGPELNVDMFVNSDTDADQAVESDMSTETLTPEMPSNMVTACEEFGSSTCFANNDCAEDGRCQNVGSENNPIACCVLGIRGTLQSGEGCNPESGQEDCASSLCVAYGGGAEAYCSGECLSDEDCPETMPSCISVAFSGSDLMWCFPASN